MFIYIVECRYNGVQYINILHILLQEPRQNINQGLNPNGQAMGMPFMNIVEKNWPRYNGTAL